MTQLQNAAKAIREGDKKLGKKLLVELLKEDPTNDMAWLWMSAVIGTDKRRRECLEEALRHNPNNQTAQKELQKLKQSGQPSSPSLGNRPKQPPTGMKRLSQHMGPNQPLLTETRSV